MELLRKKKFWSAVMTAIAAGVSYYTGNEQLGNAIVVVGTALVAALGAEDWGKAKNA